MFLSHAYLTVDPPVDRDYPAALRVVDEKVWPALTRTSHLAIDDLMRAPAATFPEHLPARFTGRRRPSRRPATRSSAPRPCPGRRDRHRAVEGLAKEESQSRAILEIGPWQSADTLAFRLRPSTRSPSSPRAAATPVRTPVRAGDGTLRGPDPSELKTEHGSHQVIQSSGSKLSIAMRRCSSSTPMPIPT